MGAQHGGADGLLFGNPRQLAVQAVAVAAAMAFSAAGTFVLLKLVSLVAPLRTAPRDEGLGLDVSQHGEEAYTHGEGAILVLPREISGPPGERRDPVARLAPEGGAL